MLPGMETLHQILAALRTFSPPLRWFLAVVLALLAVAQVIEASGSLIDVLR